MIEFMGCKKGKWPFRWHNWERKSDLKVIPQSNWAHSIYMSLNGHNIVERNVRYACSKCGRIEKE